MVETIELGLHFRIGIAVRQEPGVHVFAACRARARNDSVDDEDLAGFFALVARNLELQAADLEAVQAGTVTLVSSADFVSLPPRAARSPARPGLPGARLLRHLQLAGMDVCVEMQLVVDDGKAGLPRSFSIVSVIRSNNVSDTRFSKRSGSTGCVKSP